ncbi:conserved Plasmodium membrane protein, unknown function [Plasmodium malariae]|uniref:C2 domain-containing protein n=1 Tax=Plasmodium malariae TaxID=5858 RepID=A0A1D3PCQ1_PLAMA|nr:conserved Plasmodium membrane protein, unknown function [Plasmodium malariae]SCN12938.1 conserved Plasmodium membrane protein, unknown function [Plasmodium malariae]
MSTWINKKLISFSEKVIENVIDSFANKNAPIENIQNIQGTQLGKIISKVISSKYFFKNDDICYNAKDLDFNWNLKKRTKRRKQIRSRVITKSIEDELFDENQNRRRGGDQRKRSVQNGRKGQKKSIRKRIPRQSSDSQSKARDLSIDKHGEDVYNYVYKDEKDTNQLKIDESYITSALSLNARNVASETDENKKGSMIKKDVLFNSSVCSVLSEVKNKASSFNSNEAAGYVSVSFCTSNYSSDTSTSVSANSFKESSSIDTNEKSSSNVLSSSCCSFKTEKASPQMGRNEKEAVNGGGLGSELGSGLCSGLHNDLQNNSFNSNILSTDKDACVMQKESSLCKINVFVKEAKLLFFNKNVSISDISIYVTTIIEDKKYVGKLRKLSSKTLPMNNLTFNECVNHNLKDIFSDIVINIKYKNRKKEKEDMILGRVIIPLFLLLNTYKCKMKRIKNKIKYCTKCFLWLHIFPSNNKLFNYKFFKPVEGFEEYGMLNPLYTLGFLSVQVKIIFKRNPLLLTFFSNIRKPLFYYKMPIQFEPLYCQYYTENFFVYVTQLPIWLYKFFYIFNSKRIEIVPLNYYDYVFIFFFWLFFFRLIVICPFFHIFVHLFFCIIFISLSYKYGMIRYSRNVTYNFRPVQMRRNEMTYKHTKCKANTSLYTPSNDTKNVHFFDKNRRISLTANDIDSNYCKSPCIMSDDDNTDKALSPGDGVHVTNKKLSGECTSAKRGEEGTHSKTILSVYDTYKSFIAKGDLKNVFKGIVIDSKDRSNGVKDKKKKNEGGGEAAFRGKNGCDANSLNSTNSLVNELNTNSSLNSNLGRTLNSTLNSMNKTSNSSGKVVFFRIEENCFVKKDDTVNDDNANDDNANDDNANDDNSNDDNANDGSVKKTDDILKEEKKDAGVEANISVRKTNEGKLDMLNVSEEINNKINNMTKFAKKLQHMMFDSKDKNKLDYFDKGKSLNKFMSMFNGKNEKSEKIHSDGTENEEGEEEEERGEEEEEEKEEEEKETDEDAYEDEDEYIHVGEEKEYLLSDRRGGKSKSQKKDDPDDLPSSAQKKVQRLGHNKGRDKYNREIDKEKKYIQHGSKMNKTVYTNDIRLNSSCTISDEKSVDYHMRINNDVIPNSLIVNNKKISISSSKMESTNMTYKNFVTLSSDNNNRGGDSHYCYSNNILESKFTKKNFILDTFKNNMSLSNETKNTNDIKKKYSFMPIVKSPFHNFYLCMSTIDNRSISIFSNNIDVPNVHLLLNRCLNMITLTQNFTGIFTIIYEKINYAFNWDFSFYTIVNILILFFLCYSISLILYILSFIPFLFYRFLFFLFLSLVIIRSYELTEAGHRASLYYKKKKKKCNSKKGMKCLGLQVYNKIFIRIIKNILKNEEEKSIKYLFWKFIFKIYKYVSKNASKHAYTVLLYISFVLFFLKNWFRRLLILKDIEHMKIARLQAFKNLYFFIHNRLTRKEAMYAGASSNNNNAAGGNSNSAARSNPDVSNSNIATSSNDNNAATCDSSNNTMKVSEHNNGCNSSNRINEIFSLNRKSSGEKKCTSTDEKNKKKFLNPQVYDTFRSVEECIYSSSDREEAPSVINDNKVVNMDEDDDDDVDSVSQLTDNGTMNVNVDIFLHYYFKKRKYDLFNNFININRNHMYMYKDINLLNHNEEQKLNSINYEEYFNGLNNYSSSYDNNKKRRS